MIPFLLQVFLFFAVATCLFLFFRWLAPSQAIEDRLAPDQDQTERKMVFGELTPALAGQSPVLTEANRQSLETELRHAGFYRPSALIEYRAIRAVLIFVPILLALVLATLVERSAVITVLIIGGILAILGYSLPRIYLNYVAARRINSIRRGLPVAIDLISLGLTAGQNVLAAVQRASEQIDLSYPDLAYELRVVVHQARLNTLPHALEKFADRVDLQEARSLAVLVSQAQMLGADTATALLDFSTAYRTNLRHQAEQQANRASFWMLFPSILCLWIPAGIILMGPIFFEFRHQREQSAEIMQKGLKSAEKAGSNPAPTTPTPAEEE